MWTGDGFKVVNGGSQGNHSFTETSRHRQRTSSAAREPLGKSWSDCSLFHQLSVVMGVIPLSAFASSSLTDDIGHD
jgi:hypothetical protein